MRFKIIFLFMGVFIFSGCALSSEETIELTSEPVINIMTATPQPQFADIAGNEPVAEVTDEPIETITSDTTSDSSPSPSNQVETHSNQTNTVSVSVASSNINNTTCTTRTDLPLYTVVAGDTLFGIATRANTTVDNIVSINCLNDSNLIAVGQQLRLPTEITRSTTSNTNTNIVHPTEPPNRIGTVIISPWHSNDGNTYTINTSHELDIRWMGMPTDLGLIHVEFIYDDARPNFMPISIGIDTDLSDGARVGWNPPNDIQGSIYATARIPGQYHHGVSSQLSYVTADNTPLVTGPRGALSVDPNIQAGTPSDWSDYVVEAGTTVTVRWTGVDPEEYTTLRMATLHFQPDSNGDEQIIAHDQNRSDGFSFVWTVPENASGTFYVNGIVGDTAGVIFSPNIHVRTPETNNFACSTTLQSNQLTYGLPDPQNSTGTPTDNGTYEVVGNSPNGWYLIKLENDQRWGQVTVSGDCQALETFYYSCYFYFSAEDAIYARPDTSADQMATANVGDSYRMIYRNGNWLEIIYNPQRAVRGFVASTSGYLEGDCSL